MITFEQAYQIILQHVIPLSTERVTLDRAFGRVLAEDIFSDMDMPPFHKSAVDGFACRIEDLNLDIQSSVSLTIVETIPAGVIPGKKIIKGQCSRIMTGSMLPEGSDCVVMVEDTVTLDENRIRVMKRGTALNICKTGEDIKKGEKLLGKGKLLSPLHIGVLATAGSVNPLVYRKVKVAVISTGNELVEPDELPGLSKIRNSNASQLMAQVAQACASAKYYGIASDDARLLNAKIAVALKSNDVVILSGGVSMGDFDYVPEVLVKMGVKIFIDSIAVQPGKPTVFGKIRGRFIFGLPGNPVSSFLIFRLLVKPFLMGLMGFLGEIPSIVLPLGKDLARAKSSRKSMIPVRIVNGELFPIDYHGSAHLNAWSEADGIIAMEIGQTLLKKGEPINVRQI